MLVEEVRINITVAERKYTFTVPAAREEAIRKSAVLLNERLTEAVKVFKHEDYQDHLALIALDCMTENIQTQSQLMPEYLNLVSEIYRDLYKALPQD